MLDIFFHWLKMHIAWPAYLELQRRNIGLIFCILEHRYVQLFRTLVKSFGFGKPGERLPRQESRFSGLGNPAQ
jgi:hypothetical protein